MKRRAKLGFVLAAACNACNPSGDDVFLGTTQQPTAAVSCTLVPGEDACMRFAAQSADARSVIANATSFAGDSRDLVRRLDAACLDVVVALGATRKPAMGTEPRDRMEAVCGDAFDALSARKLSSVTTTSERVGCSVAPVPACILNAISVGWQSCTPPKVTVEGGAPDGAGAAVVERTLPPMIAAWAEVSFLGERGKQVQVVLTSDDEGASQKTRVCVAESAHLVSEALLDLASVVRVSPQGAAAVALTTRN